MRLLSALLSLYLLNLCIDPIVQTPETNEDEVGYSNEIDSLVELVSEELLNCDNLIPESSADETNNSVSTKIAIIIFSPENSIGLEPPAFFDEVTKASAFFSGNSSACLRLPSPPPKG